MKNESVDIRPYTRQFYKGSGVILVFLFFHIILDTLLNLTVSWLLQQFTDLIGGNEAALEFGTLIIITLLTLLPFALSFAISYCLKPKFVARGISAYKEFVFKKITEKKISAMSNEGVAGYISMLTNDIQTISDGYLLTVLDLISGILTFIGAIALMLWYSPTLTLAAVLLSLLPLILSLLLGGKMAKEERNVSDRQGEYTATVRDCLEGFAVVKSFRAEKQILSIFKENIKRLKAAQSSKDKYKILVDSLGGLAGFIAQIGVFVFGAYLALSGSNISAGSVLIFVQLMNYVLMPIQTVPVCLAKRKAARKLVKKMADALSKNVQETQVTNHIKLSEKIELDSVSFGYEEGKLALNGVSCDFELGKKYAIVGASGSGKSTLLNLLMAAHQNYSGTIKYDGRELREIDCENLYEIESIIQQSVFVFNATIRDNITMFCEFPEQEINDAIRRSGLSELIKERGADYLCGENGCALSGGEKQRISIARSLIRKSQVLLVDEATAALDAETAYQVLSEILSLSGITAIIVTHSLNEGLLTQYDGILTLKNGSLVEAGTFSQLMEKKGYFYSLFTVSQ